LISNKIQWFQVDMGRKNPLISFIKYIIFFVIVTQEN